MTLLHECNATVHQSDAASPPADPFAFTRSMDRNAHKKLQVTSDSLLCGSWTVPYDAIESAEFLFPPRQLGTPRIPVAVLRVKSRGSIYDFGVMYRGFWKGELPFEVKREEPPPPSSLSTWFWLCFALLFAVIVAWQFLNQG